MVMTRNYTETVVPCGVCGTELSDHELIFLWGDTDWLCHGSDGHRVCIAEDDRQLYYRTARCLTQEAGRWCLVCGLELYLDGSLGWLHPGGSVFGINGHRSVPVSREQLDNPRG